MPHYTSLTLLGVRYWTRCISDATGGTEDGANWEM